MFLVPSSFKRFDKVRAQCVDCLTVLKFFPFHRLLDIHVSELGPLDCHMGIEPVSWLKPVC